VKPVDADSCTGDLIIATSDCVAMMAIAGRDKQFEDHLVCSVSDDQVVTFESGFCLAVHDELLSTPRPLPGDTLRLFGRGFGYVVRGIGLVTAGRLVGLYRYQTEAQEAAGHAQEVAASKQHQRDEWEARKDATAIAIRALPEPFRCRIEFFMRQPEWGPEFGLYELFCCTEAVKLVDMLKSQDSVCAFVEMNSEAQKIAAPGLAYDQHSGNTLGMSCRLAYVFMSQPELLFKVHGASCPIVGCKAYGCFATTIQG
jgi:hypothetical protein